MVSCDNFKLTSHKIFQIPSQVFTFSFSLLFIIDSVISAHARDTNLIFSSLFSVELVLLNIHLLSYQFSKVKSLPSFLASYQRHDSSSPEEIHFLAIVNRAILHVSTHFCGRICIQIGDRYHPSLLTESFYCRKLTMPPNNFSTTETNASPAAEEPSPFDKINLLNVSLRQ